MNPERVSTYILLTGAGFTYNFGGFLAKEMWANIFVNPMVQDNSLIRKMMLDVSNDYDYEAIYQDIVWSNKAEISEADKKSLTKAVSEAYQRLDTNVRDQSKRLHLDPINDLIQCFEGNSSKVDGFFFTLNQDIFVERFYQHGTKKPLTLPSVKKVPADADTSKRKRPLSGGDFVVLPSREEIEEPLNPVEFHYIKLHGAFNWRSSQNGDMMAIIGSNKKEQIEREPLLSWYYHELFEKVLTLRDRKLLVIGYGFKDDHINEVIFRAMKHNNLQLYILSPTDPKEMLAAVKKKIPCVVEHLYGYYPYNLKEVCSEEASSVFIDVMKKYFFRET